MAEYDLSHPLGLDVEKIHVALLAGMSEILSGEAGKPRYRDSLRAQFKNALETGTGYSQLKLADVAIGRLVWLESAVAVPEDNPEWVVQWGESRATVRHRIQVRDALFEKIPTPLSETLDVADKLTYNITDGGIVLAMTVDKDKDEIIGCYDDNDYDRISINMRLETGLDELIALTDAA